MKLDSTVVMRDTAHSQLKILLFANTLCLEWGVLRLTLTNKSAAVWVRCREVRCVVAHFRMAFYNMDYGVSHK